MSDSQNISLCLNFHLFVEVSKERKNCKAHNTHSFSLSQTHTHTSHTRTYTHKHTHTHTQTHTHTYTHSHTHTLRFYLFRKSFAKSMSSSSQSLRSPHEPGEKVLDREGGKEAADNTGAPHRWLADLKCVLKTFFFRAHDRCKNSS